MYIHQSLWMHRKGGRAGFMPKDEGIDGPRSIPDDDGDWTQCCVAKERAGEGGLNKGGWNGMKAEWM